MGSWYRAMREMEARVRSSAVFFFGGGVVFVRVLLVAPGRCGRVE